MFPDRRFTDADLRRDSQLRAVAHAYAREYHGDWEPMVDAKRLAEAGEELPVPIARMVLNTMRGDAAFWKGSHSLATTRNFEGDLDPNPKNKTALTVVDDKRIITVDTRVKLHRDYGLAHGGKVHRIDHRKTFCKWTAERVGPYGRTGPWDFEKRIPKLHITWACGKWPVNFTLLDGVEADEVAQERGACPVCFI